MCDVGTCDAHRQAAVDQANYSNNCSQEAVAHEAELQEGAPKFGAHVRNTVSKQNSAKEDALNRFETVWTCIPKPKRVARIKSERT